MAGEVDCGLDAADAEHAGFCCDACGHGFWEGDGGGWCEHCGCTLCPQCWGAEAVDDLYVWWCQACQDDPGWCE